MKPLFCYCFVVFWLAGVGMSIPANATKETDMPGAETMQQVPSGGNRPHDDIRYMSTDGMTVCSAFAISLLLNPAAENQKAHFSFARHELVHLGACRVVETMPEFWHIDKVMTITDDGEEMLLYLESVYSFIQDAEFGDNAIRIKKEYALCWQTSDDRGCF